MWEGGARRQAPTVVISELPPIAVLDELLLVEDDDADARLVEHMLRDVVGEAIHLTRVRTLAEALEWVDRRPHSCVLLDLGLPDAEGLEALHAITGRAPTTPVVVLTGRDDGALATKAVVAGAQDYLVKGIAIDDTLGRAIRYAVVRKRVGDELVRSRQALEEAQRIAHVGSWELDLSMNEMVWSDELYRLYGRTAGQTCTADDLTASAHPEDREGIREAIASTVAGHGSFDVEHRVLLRDGTIRWLRSQGRVELDDAGEASGARGTAQDITEQRSAQDALAHRSLHDPLTGLPNRVLLLDRLNQALNRVGRSHTFVGLLFLDIDRFKVVNDSLGHAAGDEMLLAMAHRLRGALRASDTLARFGGDEFVILCEELTGEAEALAIAARISDALAQPLSWGGGELVVTVSAGIALAGSALVPAESLLRDADAAMYCAKEDGRARATVFAESMRATAIGRLDTEVLLRHAIADGLLELHFQPIVELASRRITAVEALVRWRHPSRGLTAPDEFIPVAEETGLIVPMGAWVLREAARCAKAWQQRPGRADLSVSVNLSAAQIVNPGLLDLVALVLDESSLEPETLKLEITESVLMKDAPAAMSILGGLKSIGVQLSVDDFGTGYSSLALLKRLPVDELKIDRSFVEGLGTDCDDSAIVEAITSLSAALRLTTVAEGVETAVQAGSLVDLGCRYAQGYYFARPAPADHIDVLLDGPAEPGAASPGRAGSGGAGSGGAGSGTAV